MTDDLSRPFTREELEVSITQAEEAFRTHLRAAELRYQQGEYPDLDRLYSSAAENATVLAELRYQRERLS